MAVASLTIAAITAKTGEVVGGGETGYDTTVGNTTHHFTAPVFVPDPPGSGKWAPFPIRPFHDAPPFLKDFVDGSALEFISKLNALVTPTISLVNGLVIGNGLPSLNHDGKAYGGSVSNQPIGEADSKRTDAEVRSSLVALQIEYQKNIKSGKWRGFINGE